MPHSSGGCSHGGGSHGGSHGGGHYGSSGGSSRRVSSHHFSGARTFVYFRNSQPVYVYSNYDLKNDKQSWLNLIPTFFMLPFIAIMIFFIVLECKPPVKINPSVSYSISIEDNAGVLGNTGNLYEQLVIFKEKTGITPVIVTVKNSAWKNYYMDLERYSYDLYLNNFDDEDHWLIVYSEPSSWTIFNDWHFEAIQGNNTDGILTEKKCNKFIESIDKNLLSNNSVSQALENTFSDFNDYVMSTDPDIEVVLVMSFFSSLLITVVIVGIVKCFGKKYKAEELQEVYAQSQSTIKPIKCAYCQSYYVIDDKTHNCPHCGAGNIESEIK